MIEPATAEKPTLILALRAPALRPRRFTRAPFGS
jgi:hypothetical protein